MISANIYFLAKLFIIASVGVTGSVENNCHARDGRGFDWSSDTKDCSEVDQDLIGVALWPCNSTTGLFMTAEPDRSPCRSPTLGGVSDLSSIHDYITSKPRPLVGGELIQIIEIITRTDNGDQLELMTKVTDSLFSEGISWQELPRSTVLHTEYLTRSHLVAELITAVQIISSLRTPATFAFNGLNLIVEVVSFSATATAQFPTDQSWSNSSLMLELDQQETPIFYLGLLLKGRAGVSEAFLGSPFEEQAMTQIGSDLVHFSCLSEADNIKLGTFRLPAVVEGSGVHLHCGLFRNRSDSSFARWYRWGSEEEPDRCVVNHDWDKTYQVVYGRIFDQMLPTTAVPTTTEPTTTTTSVASSSTSTLSPTTTSDANNESSSTVSSESSSPVVQSSTTSGGTACTYSQPDTVYTFLYVMTSLALAVCAATVLLHLLYVRKRLLPGFYSKLCILLLSTNICSVLFACGLSAARRTIFQVCFEEELIEQIKDHQMAFNSLSPLLLTVWTIQLLVILTISILILLEIRGWRGIQTLTGGLAVLLLLVVLPVVMMAACCISFGHFANFAPLVLPEFGWEALPNSNSLRSGSNLVMIVYGMVFLLVMLVSLLVMISLILSWYFPRKDHFSKGFFKRMFVRDPFPSKPYISMVNIIIFIFWIKFLIVWPTFLAFMSNTVEECAAAYFAAILELLHQVGLLLLYIYWTVTSFRQQVLRAESRAPRPGGVLQQFVKFKRGQSVRPKGVRGTLRKDRSRHSSQQQAASHSATSGTASNATDSRLQQQDRGQLEINNPLPPDDLNEMYSVPVKQNVAVQPNVEHDRAERPEPGSNPFGDSVDGKINNFVDQHQRDFAVANLNAKDFHRQRRKGVTSNRMDTSIAKHSLSQKQKSSARNLSPSANYRHSSDKDHFTFDLSSTLERKHDDQPDNRYENYFTRGSVYGQTHAGRQISPAQGQDDFLIRNVIEPRGRAAQNRVWQYSATATGSTSSNDSVFAKSLGGNVLDKQDSLTRLHKTEVDNLRLHLH